MVSNTIINANAFILNNNHKPKKLLHCRFIDDWFRIIATKLDLLT